MNDAIFYFFYNFAHKSAWVDGLIIFCATYLQYFVIFLAVIFLLTHNEVLSTSNPIKEFVKKWKEILTIFFISGAAWVVAKILKTLIQTERPFLALGDVQALFSETGYAFPSGHATFFMALAVGLFFYHKKIGYVFMLFAIVIGITRIMGGVHFPVDILGGFALGALVAYLAKNV